MRASHGPNPSESLGLNLHPSTLSLDIWKETEYRIYKVYSKNIFRSQFILSTTW